MKRGKKRGGGEGGFVCGGKKVGFFSISRIREGGKIKRVHPEKKDST